VITNAKFRVGGNKWAPVYARTMAGWRWQDFSGCARESIPLERIHRATSCCRQIPPLSVPASFNYAAGADMGVTKRLTVVADWVGQLYFDAPQVSTPKNVASLVNNQPMSFPSVVLVNGSYQVNSLAVGIKANPVKHLLVTANVTVKVGEGGLRAKLVPLVGISYSFSDVELGILHRSQQPKCPCPKE